MKQNEQFSYHEEANQIVDDYVADKDYSTVLKAICYTLSFVGGAMVLASFKGAKARRLAKKLARR